MAKSKTGGVAGFLKGSVGSATYSIIAAKNSRTGKKEQMVRQKVTEVYNPNSTAQILQRMKIGPAQRFFSGFDTVLSNAFEGVPYGNASRRYFLQKAMSENGPYVPKGVDRIIPAEYLVSEGSLPAVPYASRANFIILDNLTQKWNVVTDVTNIGGAPTQEKLAEALGVDVNTQLSFVVFSNDNGIFTPHFAGFDERLLIKDLDFDGVNPQYALQTIDGVQKIAFIPAGFGIDVDNVVAAAIILSKQDASGNWLRSTQYMQLNELMYNQLYSVEAMESAIASYSAKRKFNAIGSQWYLNLGLNQAFNGSIRTNALILNLSNGVSSVMAATGLKADGTSCYFGIKNTAGAWIGLVCVQGSEVYIDARINADSAPDVFAGNVELWDPSYATQAGWTSRIIVANFDFPVNVSNLEGKTMTADFDVTMEDLEAGNGLKFASTDGSTVIVVDSQLKVDNDPFNYLTINGRTITFGGWTSGPELVSFTFGV